MLQNAAELRGRSECTVRAALSVPYLPHPLPPLPTYPAAAHTPCSMSQGVDKLPSRAAPRPESNNNPTFGPRGWGIGAWASLLTFRDVYLAPRNSRRLTALTSTAAASGSPNGNWAQPTSNDSKRSSTSPPKHVIFFANGLFGSPLNWSTVMEEIRSKPDLGEVLLYPSQANRRTDTFDGIDVCGQRLADEMRSVVAQNPSLERISVIGHSMGGLLLRYAVAQLFNPDSNTIAGLAPTHFITLATPHLGCDSDGVAQVPFIGWAGPLLTPLLQRLSIPTAATLFKRTGLQFFLEDPEAAQGSAKPLLLRMTEDDPDRGLFFYSALGSFTSRTAYANTDQDHLVGWPNSSLRFSHELPELPATHATAKGVVLEDDVMSAFTNVFRPAAPSDLPPAQPSKLFTQTSLAASTSGTAATMLQRLQQLPWRRIDVCFNGSPLAILSHNHIQVTRRWLNSEGRSVAVHLAEQLVALEEALAQLELAGGRAKSSPQLQQQGRDGLTQKASAAGALDSRGGGGSGWAGVQARVSASDEVAWLSETALLPRSLAPLLQLQGDELVDMEEEPAEPAPGGDEDPAEQSWAVAGIDAPIQNRGQAPPVEQPAG